ncbi:hypothetical protein EJ02DRAFT_495031 [Clathrospora elynae]|uniref:Uncharacterized protein n=1 Tax=Clathrospora elynae TaxID=706981 RepID=A0A6A5SJS5_9PLEO|nr:hypothetical protein EJ02DRAFT_495031 [Clathrospora elynae]
MQNNGAPLKRKSSDAQQARRPRARHSNQIPVEEQRVIDFRSPRTAQPQRSSPYQHSPAYQNRQSQPRLFRSYIDLTQEEAIVRKQIDCPPQQHYGQPPTQPRSQVGRPLTQWEALQAIIRARQQPVGHYPSQGASYPVQNVPPFQNQHRQGGQYSMPLRLPSGYTEVRQQLARPVLPQPPIRTIDDGRPRQQRERELSWEEIEQVLDEWSERIVPPSMPDGISDQFRQGHSSRQDSPLKPENANPSPPTPTPTPAPAAAPPPGLPLDLTQPHIVNDLIRQTNETGLIYNDMDAFGQAWMDSMMREPKTSSSA